MVSALLGFMAVSGVLGKWNLSRLEVRFLPASEIYDGLPTLLGIELVNRRRRMPVLLMEVVIAEARVLFPLVDPHRAQRKNLEMTFRGRGRQRLPQVILSSRFPINFFVRSKAFDPDQFLTVFPAPKPCAERDYPDPGGERGDHQAWSRGQDGDISRISNYQGGEPLKLIHWKLSARHDSLKVKELSAATRAPVILDLALLPGGTLEQRLGSAVFLVLRMLREGRPVGLRTGQAEIPAATGRQHRLQLLEALANHGQN
jgi:uncharacterized protein (DUF58 family)